MSPLRRLLVPGLSTLVMLAVLLGLGTWQVERLAWKERILGQIARAENGPAVPLGAQPEPFAKVQVAGTFRAGVTALYGAQGHDTPQGPQLGAQLLAVLDRPVGAPLLVDLGWVPTPSPGPTAPPAGPAVVQGFIRHSDVPGMFSAKDDVTGRRFYTLDAPVIGRTLGIPNVAPFILVALGHVPPGVYPIPATTLPRPPNNHLSYAITWYGLAAALLVIFGLYARKVPRS